MVNNPTRWDASAAFLWPALGFAAASEMSSLIARQLLGLASSRRQTEDAQADEGWATPHQVSLQLDSVVLRDFSAAPAGPATLICAPYALHRATIADFAPGHSLVAALREAGLARLFVADWRSATPAMQDFSIDTYLADLNVLVDQLGAPVDLVGLCQGGWLSLMYAARFPAKVRKLVLAGAPVDVAAADSFLSQAVAATPAALFRELVTLGEGRVLGRCLFERWLPGVPEAAEVRAILQLPKTSDAEAFRQIETRFDTWYRTVVDLPGRYYLEAVERLFRANELATGRFVALGQRLALSAVRAPLHLLVARHDEFVAPPQALAVEHLVATRADDRAKLVLPCRHLSLFMGRDVLARAWPQIAAWLNDARAPGASPARSAA